MADKAESKTEKKRERRTEEQRLLDLHAQIAKIEQKKEEKKNKRAQFLRSRIKINEGKIANIQGKIETDQQELDELALDTTFDVVEVEEV